MTQLLTGSALAVVLAFGVVADAHAWQRTRTVTGVNGNTASLNGSGSCSGGTCTRTQTRTGPAGNTATVNGGVTCNGISCTQSSTRTGRFGGTVSRSGSISR
ncbi:hypothetical protein [Acuticoccus kandeliae]|uniref:hypothetical protein n=1 Tax=Acuticoccus kandeliae TaxID=2073160 RepID=UPI00196B1206|nr:hypothetical protein [Acuticoccus kandeliae]